jgi:hypothetical protein
MTQEPSRPPPQSAIQATGQVASDVIGGLRNQPALLAVVVLNVIAIGMAVWFLRDLTESAREFRTQLIDIISKCLINKAPT